MGIFSVCLAIPFGRRSSLCLSAAVKARQHQKCVRIDLSQSPTTYTHLPFDANSSLTPDILIPASGHAISAPSLVRVVCVSTGARPRGPRGGEGGGGTTQRSQSRMTSGGCHAPAADCACAAPWAPGSRGYTSLERRPKAARMDAAVIARQDTCFFSLSMFRVPTMCTIIPWYISGSKALARISPIAVCAQACDASWGAASPAPLPPPRRMPVHYRARPMCQANLVAYELLHGSAPLAALVADHRRCLTAGLPAGLTAGLTSGAEGGMAGAPAGRSSSPWQSLLAR